MSVKQMTAQQVQQRIEKTGELPLCLDVREPAEFNIAKIEGSVLIPMGEIMERIDELDKQQETVVICHHGMRSLQVAEYLVNCGFDKVANLLGGIDAWSSQCDPDVPRY